MGCSGMKTSSTKTATQIAMSHAFTDQVRGEPIDGPPPRGGASARM